MSGFSHVAIATPPHRLDSRAVQQISQQWPRDDATAQEKFLRIARNSGVGNRRYILPYESILGLSGLSQRAALFEEHGVELLTAVINETLEQNDIDGAEIGALVFTSCSVPVIPSIDAAAALRCSLSPSVARVPIFQHGCAGGVIGLSLGSRLAAAGKPVLVASVELCSLVFQPGNSAGAQLVGAAIFADGAAATIIVPGPATITILDTCSTLIPETRHLMGYDIFDDGFHLRLDRGLPAALVSEAPAIVARFLNTHSLSIEDIDYWLFHPGGIKILDFLRETFALAPEQCHWAYDTLRDHGNMSSATILYVCKAFIEAEVLEPGQKALIVGIGPGLTVELILLEG